MLRPSGMFGGKPPKYAVHVTCEFTREEVAVIQEMGIGETIVYQEPRQAAA